jgi:translation initiation factor 2 gamma subunit (eIF-2gamma)
VQVIATAGHVDHGKSALVRALTGMEPDRWAEERRRGLTIDLGFAWTKLPQPFTTAEARQALGTTRRVAIPLLEYLDRTGTTQRLPDDRRRLK